MLIDEIETSAQALAEDKRAWGDAEFEADRIVTSGCWWPRIRAALLAARDVNQELTWARANVVAYVETHAQCRFREAMGK